MADEGFGGYWGQKTNQGDVIDNIKYSRWDSRFHQFITKITESPWFNGLIMFTIFLNALFMALETENEIKSMNPDLFLIMDELFLAVYSIEFLMKVYAEPKGYWKSGYNLFDFLVLAISLLQAILYKIDAGETELGALKILRALRALRTLRTISFIRGLQVLVTALLDTIRKSVLNIVMLLLLLMFLFGIMGYYFFGYKEDGDKENWGSLGAAMLTLFSYVTVDGWTDLQHSLDKRGMSESRAYTVLFIFLGHFIFTNVFIAVIIMNISEATENYKKEQLEEREVILKHKKEFMMKRQHNEVKEMMERQRKGEYTNFNEMVAGYQKALRHDDYVFMSDTSTNLLWLELYLKMLDHMENTTARIQQLQFEMADVVTEVMDMRLKKKYGMI